MPRKLRPNTTRWAEGELDAAREAADSIDMTLNDFIRRAVQFAVDDVRRLHENPAAARDDLGDLQLAFLSRAVRGRSAEAEKQVVKPPSVPSDSPLD